MRLLCHVTYNKALGWLLIWKDIYMTKRAVLQTRSVSHFLYPLYLVDVETIAPEPTNKENITRLMEQFFVKRILIADPTTTRYKRPSTSWSFDAVTSYRVPY